MAIGKKLPTNVKRKLHDLLRSNTNIFTWTYANMIGISRTIVVEGKPFNTEHGLNKHKHIEPVKQKKRSLAPDQNEAICKEVEELMKADILREVKYQTWVSNPVMVRKDNGKWKMCIDFIDVNKACPKDCYPLPEDNQKIESLSKPEKSRWIPKWAIELGKNGIKFRGCNSVKGKVLADFLVVTFSYESEEARAKKPTMKDEEAESKNMWKLYTDGASSSDRFGACLILTYGFEAIVPIEISVETKRVKEFKVKLSEKRHKEDLDIFKERREIASIREAYYKQKMERYYNNTSGHLHSSQGRICLNFIFLILCSGGI
nr:reverse transcriptase domain-containing protein [Tanacetum cinerariifolium]